MKINLIIFIALLLFTACVPNIESSLDKKIKSLLHTEVIERGDKALNMEPITVTASRAERSAGDIHDFYSEGDYWWPNPENPDGPYIRHDGQTNPDNFVDHRIAMIRMSQLVGDLTSAYILTGKKEYIYAAMNHINAWFVNPETRMNPNLQYAQAIKGVVTGRGIGIIDTIHLIEVAQALTIIEEDKLINTSELESVKNWFTDYLTWISSHQYGTDEMNAKNNHGTCWVMQAAAFATFTGNNEMLNFCRERYKTVLLPNQMAENGSFPLEMSRTKPYGYSLFNLDAMTTICHILSTQEDNLWEYATPDGKNINKGVSFLFPYVKDKSSWPLAPDVMFWEEWPVAHPFLLFSMLNNYNEDYYKIWAGLEHFPTNEEVVRNLPIRHPLMWLSEKLTN